MKKTTIILSDKVINNLIRTLIPRKDVFIFEEMPLTFSKKGYLVVSKDVFFNHSEYKNIHFNNTYQYWAFNKKVSYIIIAKPQWIFSLKKEEQEYIFKNQLELNRGLVIDYHQDITIDSYYNEAQINGKLVLTNMLFYSLNKDTKELIVKSIIESFDELESYEPNFIKYKHIRKVVNNFILKDGSNCFSTTLYAITKDSFILKEWVFPNTFLNYLNEYNYKQIDSEEFLENDVLVVKNNDNMIHAAYAIRHNLFLNKNGQMKFNPVKIVDLTYLKTEFQGEILCFRR